MVRVGTSADLNKRMNHIAWAKTTRRLTLAARGKKGSEGYTNPVTEEQMNLVQKWCEKHKCGTRISFDMIRFKNQKEMSMFLLKWS